MLTTRPIYENPRIQNGIYCAKCISVITSDDPHHHCMIQLRIAPMHEEASGRTVTAILHETKKGKALLDKFRQTFRCHGIGDMKAIGRWGHISIFANTYKGTTYSNVGFIKQSPAMRNKEARFRMLERTGGLDWGNCGQTETSKPKNRNDSGKRNMTGHEDWVDLDDITFER